MSDEKILEIGDFKRIEGEVKRISGAPPKPSKKKNKNKKDQPVPDYSQHELSLEDEFIMAIEENNFLQFELMKSKIEMKILQKLLNQVLKTNQKLQTQIT